MFPSGMSRPIPKSSIVDEESAAGPEGGAISRPMSLRRSMRSHFARADGEPDCTAQDAELVARLDDPVDDLRLAPVLEVVRAARAALGPSGTRIVLVITGP